MCLLNGECGGIIPASATFGELVTEYEDGTSVVEEVPMFDIIRTVVSQFGGEQLGRIIINDLPLRGKQVLRWNGSSPLYIYYKYDNSGKKAYYFSSNENDVVMDMFMGSGSTGVACLNTNRKFIGIELDDKYFEISKSRLNKAVENKEELLKVFDKSN